MRFLTLSEYAFVYQDVLVREGKRKGTTYGSREFCNDGWKEKGQAERQAGRQAGCSASYQKSMRVAGEYMYVYVSIYTYVVNDRRTIGQWGMPESLYMCEGHKKKKRKNEEVWKVQLACVRLNETNLKERKGETDDCEIGETKNVRKRWYEREGKRVGRVVERFGRKQREELIWNFLFFFLHLLFCHLFLFFFFCFFFFFSFFFSSPSLFLFSPFYCLFGANLLVAKKAEKKKKKGVGEYGRKPSMRASSSFTHGDTNDDKLVKAREPLLALYKHRN